MPLRERADKNSEESKHAPETMFYAVEKRMKSKDIDIHTSNCWYFTHRVVDKTSAREYFYPYDTYKEAVEYAKSLDSTYTIRDCRLCRPNPQPYLKYAIEDTIRIEGASIEHVWNACKSWLLHIDADTKSEVMKQNIQATQRPIPKWDVGDYYKVIELSLEEKEDCIDINVNIKPDDTISKQHVYGLEDIVKEWPKLIEELEDYIKKSEVKILTQKTSVTINIVEAFKYLFKPREPLYTVSNVVYDEMPKPNVAESSGIVFLSAILFISFYILFYWFNFDLLIKNTIFLAATYSTSILFLYWVYKSDKYEKEPLLFIIFCFTWGVFSGLLAAPLNMLFGPYFEILGTQALVAAFVEEPIKAIGLYLLVSHKKYGKDFNTPLDGIIYGFAAGMGFFAMENFHYFLKYGPANLIIRTLYCWGHGTFVATTGLWLGIAKVKRGKLILLDVIPGMLVAMFLHFLWNGWGAWVGILSGRFIHYQTLFHLAYLRKIIREALRDETLWGFSLRREPNV